ncbi:hypothetical protein BY458DRAFT_524076 [Sporodiniella umbellata]|nr:hypothetical protein BY458DRAFT_524076 [Sporodiniella umbellata]
MYSLCFVFLFVVNSLPVSYERLYIEIESLIPHLPDNLDLMQVEVKHPGLTVYRNVMSADHEVIIRGSNSLQCVEMLGHTSDFGSQTVQLNNVPIRVFGGQGFLGCDPYSEQEAMEIQGTVLLLNIGGCGFYTKAIHAQQAGALGVIYFNDRPSLFRPSTLQAKKTVNIPSILVSRSSGSLLLKQKAIHIESSPLVKSPDYRMLLLGKPVDNIVIF